jgi:hypothetical protein
MEGPYQYSSRSVGHTVFLVYVCLPETLTFSPGGFVYCCASVRVDVRIVDLAEWSARQISMLDEYKIH